MPVLPILSGREIVTLLQRAVWQIARQRGSHIIMTKVGQEATLSIPDHKEIARGTLRSLIRASGLTAEEFIKLAD